MRKPLFLLLLSLTLALIGCQTDEPVVLRLATTTSTENSGLLGEILPMFEAEYGIRVDVVAVGTGQAIAIGEAGDADVIMVHARAREDDFIAAGHGTERFDVMYNDFVIVGPLGDPAGIANMRLANEALLAIAEKEATFASRGDDSGTHSKERDLWEAAGMTRDPEGGWYKSLGQGMSATLQFAEQSDAYVLTDRGTFLSLADTLPNLTILVGGESIAENTDETLFNPYSIIPVNPAKGGINAEAVDTFIGWLTAVETQTLIGEFGLEQHGQPLFYPDSAAWKSQ